ncbi:MAG: hypothetical protein Kow0069_21930 [Promethearchaeota archaeon]
MERGDNSVDEENRSKGGLTGAALCLVVSVATLLAAVALGWRSSFALVHAILPMGFGAFHAAQFTRKVDASWYRGDGPVAVRPAGDSWRKTRAFLAGTMAECAILLVWGIDSRSRPQMLASNRPPFVALLQAVLGATWLVAFGTQWRDAGYWMTVPGRGTLSAGLPSSKKKALIVLVSTCLLLTFLAATAELTGWGGSLGIVEAEPFAGNQRVQSWTVGLLPLASLAAVASIGVTLEVVSVRGTLSALRRLPPPPSNAPLEVRVALLAAREMSASS